MEAQRREGIELWPEQNWNGEACKAWAYSEEWDLEFCDERPAQALRLLAEGLAIESAKAAADAAKMAADAAIALAWAEELEVEP